MNAEGLKADAHRDGSRALKAYREDTSNWGELCQAPALPIVLHSDSVPEFHNTEELCEDFIQWYMCAPHPTRPDVSHHTDMYTGHACSQMQITSSSPLLYADLVSRILSRTSHTARSALACLCAPCQPQSKKAQIVVWPPSPQRASSCAHLECCAFATHECM